MHTELQLYILAYVDDLMIIGIMLAINHTMPLLNKKFLIKYTGELDTEGSSVVFLGRNLARIGDAIKFRSKGDYP